MTERVVVRCPICRKRRWYPVSEASRDTLLEAIAAHVYYRHPSIPATEAEAAIERALRNTETRSVDGSSPQRSGWN